MNRIINIYEIITGQTGDRVIAELKRLENENLEPINIYINTDGGNAFAMMRIVDQIKLSSAPIYTICNGIAASAGAWILAAGNKRFMTENAKVMIHEASRVFYVESLTADEMRDAAEHTDELNKKVIQMLAEMTGQEAEKIKNDVKGKDVYMDSIEAVNYGIVDMVINKSVKERYNLKAEELKNQKESKTMTKDELIAKAREFDIDLALLEKEGIQLKALRTEHAQLQADIGNLKAKNEALQIELSKATTAIEAERKEIAWNCFMAQGKVVPAIKEAVMAKFSTADELNAFYKDMPAVVHTQELGTGAGADKDEATEEEKEVLKARPDLTLEELRKANSKYGGNK